MPTGYTAPVESGEITDLRPFVLRCARAFGALVMFRDHPVDSGVDWDHVEEQIRKDAEATIKWNRERLQEAERRRDRLDTMTDDEIHAEIRKDRDRAVQYWIEQERQKAEENAKYDAMLAKVLQWEPPTPDHTNLKKFMVDQLTDSKRSHYPAPDPHLYDITPDEWRKKERDDIERDLEHYERRLKEHMGVVEERIQWIKALLDSLPDNDAG